MIDRKAICAGNALVLHQACQYVGLKSQIVMGKTFEGAHAWNITQIDGRWYESDITYDQEEVQNGVDYKCMLKSRKEMMKSHGIYMIMTDSPNSDNNFDYSKINGYSIFRKEREGEI